MIASGGFLDTPNASDYDADEQDDYQEDQEEYSDSLRVMKAVGNLLEYIGILLIALGLILGALKDERLQPQVRQGMIIAMGLIVGFKILTLFFMVGY